MYYYAQAQPWYVSSNVRRSFAKVLGNLVGGMAVGEHHKRGSFRVPRVAVKGDGHRVPGRTDDSFPPKDLPSYNTFLVCRQRFLHHVVMLPAHG